MAFRGMETIGFPSSWNHSKYETMSSPLRFLGPSPNPCASAYECPIGIIASKGAIYPKHTVTEMLCNSRIRLDWKSKLDSKVTYRFSENRCARASQASFLSGHAFLLSWLDVMLWAQRVFRAGGRNEVHLGTSLTLVICAFGRAGWSTFRQLSTVSWAPLMEGAWSHMGNRYNQAPFPFTAKRRMPNSSLCYISKPTSCLGLLILGSKQNLWI